MHQELCTHDARAGGLLQLAGLRNTARHESLHTLTVSCWGVEGARLAYRASGRRDLPSVLREAGGLGHEHPHLLIGWRIGHLQLQVDAIHLAERQHLF